MPDSDSSSTMTWAQFQVDLQLLGSAVDSVGALSGHMQETLGYMQSNLKMVESAWTTPSSPSFELVVDWYTSCQTQLTALLDEIVARLKVAYQNYLNVETTNTGNAS
jgi:uncharacterized protein YukE